MNNLALKFAVHSPEEEHSTLTPYFEFIAGALLSSSQRISSDDGNNKLLTRSYEALSTLVESCATESFPHVQTVLQIMIDRFASTIETEKTLVSAEDRLQHDELQSLLCETLSVRYKTKCVN